MTRYERQTIPVVDGGFSLDGEIVHVLDAPSGGARTVTALVEVDEEPAATTATDAGDTVDEEDDFLREGETLAGKTYRQLQEEAKRRGIKANQSADELREAIGTGD